jgi:alpha-glucosidase
LFWAYPEDEATYSMDDEFLCGDSLLVAPVTRPGVEYRHVYLPAGSWFHLWTGTRVDGPAHILAHAPLGQPAVYVRGNTAVPLWPEMNHVGQQEADPLTFVLYPCAGSATATLYEDAGDGYEYLNGFYARREITCKVEAGSIRVMVAEQEGTFAPARRQLRLELREIASQPLAVQARNASATWSYDPGQRRLIVELQETAAAQLIELSWSEPTRVPA